MVAAIAALAVGTLMVGQALAGAGDISTVAGDGIATFSGDGGPATSARLRNPFGVELDSSGNLFIADLGNNRIRKVDTSGNISTVAGNGSQGFSGDGGPATSTKLNNPRVVVVDSSGNLFIADTNNNRIRKVDTSGNISTVAGNGSFGLSGDGGPATSTTLSNPRGVAVDSSGNLFIADTFNQRIRKVDTSGNISTVAGNGTFGFSGDGGPATSAKLFAPMGVAVDSSGNLFIADNRNHRIRKVEDVNAEPQDNQSPVADAGANDIVEWAAGGSQVTLDGSGSSDPDGDTLTYTWTGPFSEGGGTVTGVDPTVTFQSLGLHTITLTVDDGNGGTDTDTSGYHRAGHNPAHGHRGPGACRRRG